MADKLVWVLWAELRVHGDVDAIETPTGLIPKHDDLARLFKEHLQQDYSEADYVQQFTICVPKNLAKLDRVEKIYREKVADTPQTLYDIFSKTRDRLRAVRQQQGDYISPLDLG